MRVASRFEREKGSWTKKKPFSWHGIWGYEKKVVSLQGNVVCTIHRKTCALVLENGGLVVRIKGWAKVRQRFGNGSETIVAELRKKSYLCKLYCWQYFDTN